MPNDCQSPLTVVEIPGNLPICEELFLLDTEYIDAQFPRYPDVGPPPYCMCLPINGDCGRCVTRPPEEPEEYFDDNWSAEITDTYDPEIELRMVMLNEDCCNPEFEFQLDAEFPCLPYAFEVTVEEDADLELMSVEVTRTSQSEEEWAAGFGPGGPGPDDEYDPNDKCKIEMDIKVPARPKLGVKMTHEGPGITYVNSCEPPSIQEGIRLSAAWNYDNVLKARILEITTYIDLGIPLIGKLSYNDDSVDTTIPLPPDSEPGVKVLGPPE